MGMEMVTQLAANSGTKLNGHATSSPLGSDSKVLTIMVSSGKSISVMRGFRSDRKRRMLARLWKEISISSGLSKR